MSTPADLPRHARVVIVGAGVIGCSIAYHLARAGVSDVLVLEQGQIGSGTSWHAAGLVGQLRASSTLTRMSVYGTQLYAGLEAETGLATGWKNCGSLSVARTPERLAVLRRQARRAASLGVEMQLISPAEAAARFPLMRHDDLVGAAWLPGDGKANPTDLMQSLARGARQRGVRFMEGIEVTGVTTRAVAGRSDRRTACGVVTAQGEVGCELLVNAAGLWARQFGRLAGVNVPLFAAEHFYLVTDRIAGVTPDMPVLRDPDGGIYYKEEVGGLVMGGFERHAKPWAMDPVPASFQFQLLDEDWQQFEPLMLAALQRTPCLDTAPIKMLLNGPESFTPDGSFILGEAPELANYFVCAGFNSAGIANAGGAGRLMAEWMLGGGPPGDLAEVDIRRFAPWTANRRWLAERCTETLGLHYVMRWPREELASGRPLRCSPLYDAQAARGAVFGSKNGWERALYFKPADLPATAPQPAPTLGTPAWLPWVAAEQHAARTGVALYDASSLGQLLLQGPHARTLLERAAGRTLDLAPGRLTGIRLAGPRGNARGVDTEFIALALAPQRFLLCCASAQVTRDADLLQRLVGPGEQLTLDDVSGQAAVLALIGPQAAALLASLGAPEALTLAAGRHVEADLGCTRVRLAGLNYAGGPGLEIHVAVEQARQLAQALRTAAARAGTPLVDIGSYALDGLRIEAGIRAWGAEFGPDDADDDHLMRLVLDRDTRAPGQPAEPAWAWGGEPVLRGDTVIGRVSSAGWSSLAGACVAHVRLEPGVGAPTAAAANGTVAPSAGADHLSTGWPVQLELCSEHGTGLVPARLWSHWCPPGWPGSAIPAS